MDSYIVKYVLKIKIRSFDTFQVNIITVKPLFYTIILCKKHPSLTAFVLTFLSIS